VIDVAVRETNDASHIIIGDNGPGIPAETIRGMLDLTSRTSSREAYVSPTRGAQGNALKTIVSMGFALDGKRGETVIESQGLKHRIVLSTDPVRQEPTFTHSPESSDVRIGTRVTMHWPVSSRSRLDDAQFQFLQIADDYGWLNPHLTLRLQWDRLQWDEPFEFTSTDPAWIKWKPNQPTSPHWYDPARLQRLMSAYARADQDRGREPRTVREFVSEFRGLAGTAKQKAVLDEIGAGRMSLDAYLQTGHVGSLLAAMKKQTKPVAAKHFGLIGAQHLAARFEEFGAAPGTFKYKKLLGDCDGVPTVIETAFAYCPGHVGSRRIILGINWSVCIGNPFRSLGRAGESLDTILGKQHANSDEPIIFVLHLARPVIDFTDHGKSAISLEEPA